MWPRTPPESPKLPPTCACGVSTCPCLLRALYTQYTNPNEQGGTGNKAKSAKHRSPNVPCIPVLMTLATKVNTPNLPVTSTHVVKATQSIVATPIRDRVDGGRTGS